MTRSNPPLLLWLAFAISLAAMLWAAKHGQRLQLSVAAAAFSLAAAICAQWITQSLTTSAKADSALALREISRITAAVYAWGGIALITIYRYTPLHWQHGWQYGSAMLLIAAGVLCYVVVVGRTGSALARAPAVKWTIYLTVLHGIAIIGALGWLVLSGKLGSPKGDWAANAVFLAGGLCVAWISYLAVRTHRELQQITV